MAWTQADVDKLKLAIANGAVVKRMEFADQEYEFRSLDEMRSLLAAMQSEANAGRKNHRLAATRKGA
jgi:hypothetical protein